MSWKKTESEFDGFAETYAWMLNGDKTEAPLSPGCKAAIDKFGPRSILDCACGPGWSSIALKNAGFSVHGSDISAEMVRLARANARKAGVRVPFTVAAWHDLPSRVRGQFDFVMCHGNAIGHCRGERSMVQSLSAIRQVTRDGGHLYLDTRSWEWFRTKSRRFWPGKTTTDERGRPQRSVEDDVSCLRTFGMANCISRRQGAVMISIPSAAEPAVMSLSVQLLGLLSSVFLC